MSTAIKLILGAVVFGALFFGAIWLDQSQAETGDYIKLGEVTFLTSIGAGMNESGQRSMPILLYFRSETCYWCIVFEEESLSDPYIVDLLKKNFVLVSIDPLKQKNVASNLNVRSTPYIIFFDRDGNELTRIPGYVTKEQFITELDAVIRKTRPAGS
ncbi:MAG TPA: thioredoxin family protein [Candidatus Methanoperedenaceae archaeon]|nr:thioredoxin family protein [Candidatus Methanoperedenaceae archaeon]